ncbi:MULTISPECIES: hypothetical protein [unclassified Sphingomonas]|uniref:hypothetical protein n=1 Tax=unclassified Sphingomonas TaxID=196159 RepID=UPI00082E58CF|nr:MULTISPECIES: hypothetical protein [unclassified Sphingomonas]
MRFIVWLLSAMLFVAVGWIGAPVAWHSYRAATAPNPERARQAVADALLRAYAAAPDGPATLQSGGPDTASVRGCSYDPAALLREEGVPFSKSVDWDVTSLNLRAAHSRKDGMREIRAEALAKTHSTAMLAALTACRDTPLERVCRAQLARMVAAADRTEAQALAQIAVMARESDRRILCSYLDGAAARRGIAKAAPTPQPTS